MLPTPFMRPLGSRNYGTGNVYEMRTYTFASGDIPKVLDGWGKAIEAREKFSPLAACWTSELGGLNKFVHTWVYKDLNDRAASRAKMAQDPQWPAFLSKSAPLLQQMQSVVLLPVPHSPMK